MDSEEGIVIMIFMNSFNAIHTFTALKMEIMRTYYNNNQNLNEPMNQETVFHHPPKKSIFNSLYIFLSLLLLYFLLCFFQMVVFSIKTHVQSF